jgi:hypothetical protein
MQGRVHRSVAAVAAHLLLQIVNFASGPVRALLLSINSASAADDVQHLFATQRARLRAVRLRWYNMHVRKCAYFSEQALMRTIQ